MHRKVDQFNAMKLNEYNGTFEIVSGNEGENGKFWMDWAIASEYDSGVGHGIPVKKDDGSYRSVPVKVVLGDKEHAIKNLEWLLNQITGKDSKKPEPDTGSSDVPF